MLPKYYFCFIIFVQPNPINNRLSCYECLELTEVVCVSQECVCVWWLGRWSGWRTWRNRCWSITLRREDGSRWRTATTGTSTGKSSFHFIRSHWHCKAEVHTEALDQISARAESSFTHTLLVFRWTVWAVHGGLWSYDCVLREILLCCMSGGFTHKLALKV